MPPLEVSIAALPWESRFVEQLPGDPRQGEGTRLVTHACYSEVRPTPVASPELVGWSDALAAELGIAEPVAGDPSLAILAGNQLVSGMRPYAARYGGHQFGHWAGQLGDGRAITLGEARCLGGRRHEFQLKGAGPTPYSRRADGRAVLRSSVREFLCSEAMHHLGVPTTRALSVVATGDEVIRDMFYDGHAAAEPGAVVCRVAPSFLRFGSFEILARSGETDLLRRLADYAMREHVPEVAPGDYPGFLDTVCRATAAMIVDWMRVGFVHGVMNTDNMSILGLTIDYGPYGWLEGYDPDWTPNTTDAQGRRYRFGNQAGVALWNLTRFAEALHPLVSDEERLQRSLELFRETFLKAYDSMMAKKLGLSLASVGGDGTLVDDLLALLRQAETDYTIFFRQLGDFRAGDGAKDFLQLIRPAFYADEVDQDTAVAWTLWAERYSARLEREGTPDATRRLAMNAVNPRYVLRNYMAQQAITAAEDRDPSVVKRLLRVLSRPYDEQPGESDLAAKRPEWARHAPGCSALSCSS